VNRNKQKGTAAETEVVKYLRTVTAQFDKPVFPYVERRALTGGKDQGDIAGIPATVIQVKNCEDLRLAKWKTEVLEQMRNASATRGLLVVKRKYKPVEQWDCYMPAHQLRFTHFPEDTWLRMDFALGVTFLAMDVNL
jgi:hypothetical protein